MLSWHEAGCSSRDWCGEHCICSCPRNNQMPVKSLTGRKRSERLLFPTFTNFLPPLFHLPPLLFLFLVKRTKPVVFLPWPGFCTAPFTRDFRVLRGFSRGYRHSDGAKRTGTGSFLDVLLSRERRHVMYSALNAVCEPECVQT